MKLVIAILSLVISANAAVDSPIDETAAELAARCFTSDLSKITPQNKVAVMAQLRQVAHGKGVDQKLGTAIVSRDNARVVLIRLGDVPTIEKVVGLFERYDSATAAGHLPDLLVGARQPLVIPALARSLFVNDMATTGVVFDEGHVVGPRRSTWAGVLITRVIRRCPEFSHETRAWAEQMQKLRSDDPPRFGKVMQAWWKQSAAAFDKKDFGAVKPLHEPAPNPPDPPAAAILSTPNPTQPKSERIPISGTPTVPPAAVSASTGSATSFLAVTAICLALLVGMLFFFWKRRV